MIDRNRVRFVDDKKEGHQSVEAYFVGWENGGMYNVSIDSIGYGATEDEAYENLITSLQKLFPEQNKKTCAGCEHEGIKVNPYSQCANCIRWVGIEDAYTPKTGETK